MTTTDSEMVGGPSGALVDVRAELDQMCGWRRSAPFSESEQNQWDRLSARERTLIAAESGAR